MISTRRVRIVSMYYCFFVTGLFFTFSFNSYAQGDLLNKGIQHIGLFKNTDMRLEGLIWSNWGSRPYEYYWASKVVNVKAKKIIDLGIGLPSQHSWCTFVIENLKPALYVGIDIDDRIVKEQVNSEHFVISHMSMTKIDYTDEYFDIAYCISTFEHLTYADLMKAIDEVHRVLKKNGLLIITLDEAWDKDMPYEYNNLWNVLERDLIKQELYQRDILPFGLPDFLRSIAHRFICVDDLIINQQNKVISLASMPVYQRVNHDESILHNPLYNSCVSCAVLRKVDDH